MASKIREKAKTARSAQELLNIAKAEGVAMTEEQVFIFCCLNFLFLPQFFRHPMGTT